MEAYWKRKAQLISLVTKFKETDDLFFLADALIAAALILKEQEFPITDYVKQK